MVVMGGVEALRVGLRGALTVYTGTSINGAGNKLRT